jgi:hypothetical protein
MSGPADVPRRVRRFHLLDTDVELWVPTDLADLLCPYPPDQPELTGSEVRITVRTTDGGWEVVGDSPTACNAAALPGTLLSAVNVAVLARTRKLAVHAGVVSTGVHAVAFPGGSGAGKSTITAACLRQGFEYLSDEALCLDPVTALVHPFPRPLALDDRSWRLLGEAPEGEPPVPTVAERVVPPDRFGSRGVLATRSLGHVVLLDRSSVRPELAPVHRGDALAALLRHSFNHYRMPEAAFDVVHRAVAAAQTWQLAYSDPLDAAALLRERLSAPA